MTNAVIETLMTRRSVRAFQEKEIPADQLHAILEAARFAPSGRDVRPGNSPQSPTATRSRN